MFREAGHSDAVTLFPLRMKNPDLIAGVLLIKHPKSLPRGRNVCLQQFA